VGAHSKNLDVPAVVFFRAEAGSRCVEVQVEELWLQKGKAGAEGDWWEPGSGPWKPSRRAGVRLGCHTESTIVAVRDRLRLCLATASPSSENISRKGKICRANDEEEPGGGKRTEVFFGGGG
jgi:hypothetical protein